MDFITNHLIESLLILLVGVPGSWAALKQRSSDQGAKIDKMAERMEIRDNKLDTRMEIRDNKMDAKMDNFQNTLHAMELKQVSMDANISNIQKEIKRQDEKNN